jgi:hypothetical protein
MSPRAAVICAREGLREEAAKEIRILVRENPDSPLIGSLTGVRLCGKHLCECYVRRVPAPDFVGIRY